eukprot:Gb_18940 [translate_table: standard]
MEGRGIDGQTKGTEQWTVWSPTYDPWQFVAANTNYNPHLLPTPPSPCCHLLQRDRGKNEGRGNRWPNKRDRRWTMWGPTYDPWQFVATDCRGDNINGDFDFPLMKERARTPDPHRTIRAYCQAAATLDLPGVFAIGGNAAMRRVTQRNLDFTEHSEQGDRYRELYVNL